jgi:GNAT superfamily N-acetyltransferase
MNQAEPFIIKNPSIQSEFQNRDQLLLGSLADSKLEWSFTSEYPLILSPDYSQHSWCAYEGPELVAHLNLWPRALIHQSGSKHIPVALIGNVATHPHHRNKGHMLKLMQHTEKIASSYDLQAMILWSDLFEFYQKLGFRSIGRETRFTFLKSDRHISDELMYCDPQRLSDYQLESMLELRLKQPWTMSRSIQEFRTLLGIPDAHLFLKTVGARIHSWYLMGKGRDMQGVIHEWGAKDFNDVIGSIQSILDRTQLPQVILLTPHNIPRKWQVTFALHAIKTEQHPMALAKAIGPRGNVALNAIANSFLWGLDSI